jgi:hypothetical protein
MKRTRRRFKQTTSLRERLQAFAENVRKQASGLPAGYERDELLIRAHRADVAAHIDEWANPAGPSAAEFSNRRLG